MSFIITVAALLVALLEGSSGSYQYSKFTGPVSGPVSEIIVPDAAPNPYPYGHSSFDTAIDYVAKPDYHFAYGVQDKETGNDQKHEEVRDGNEVRGEYSFMEADGSRRIVTYRVTPETGYEAVVRWEYPEGNAVEETWGETQAATGESEEFDEEGTYQETRQTYESPQVVFYRAQPESPDSPSVTYFLHRSFLEPEVAYTNQEFTSDTNSRTDYSEMFPSESQTLHDNIAMPTEFNHSSVPTPADEFFQTFLDEVNSLSEYFHSLSHFEEDEPFWESSIADSPSPVHNSSLDQNCTEPSEGTKDPRSTEERPCTLEQGEASSGEASSEQEETSSELSNNITKGN